MDASQIKDMASMRIWAVQHEGKVLSALERQCETNEDTRACLLDIQVEQRKADKKIQRWIGAGVVVAPFLVALVNRLIAKL
jgi:hypothetical protein